MPMCLAVSPVSPGFAGLFFEGECRGTDNEKPLPCFCGRMLGGLVERPGGMVIRRTGDCPGLGGPYRPAVNSGVPLCQAGVGRALGFAVLVAHGPVVISGPGPPFQPGSHPGATLPGFSRGGPQRPFWFATGLSYTPFGSVLQCNLGVCRWLVDKVGAMNDRAGKVG